MKWDARDERVRNDDTLREYAALSQTFACICFVLLLNHVGARIARPPRLWKVCDIWRTASTHLINPPAATSYSSG